MSEFFEAELAKDLTGVAPEPGRRLFRLELGSGRSLILGAEVEVDPGGVADIRREIPGDGDICAGVERAAAMIRGENLRGGQE